MNPNKTTKTEKKFLCSFLYLAQKRTFLLPHFSLCELLFLISLYLTIICWKLDVQHNRDLNTIFPHHLQDLFFPSLLVCVLTVMVQLNLFPSSMWHLMPYIRKHGLAHICSLNYLEHLIFFFDKFFLWYSCGDFSSSAFVVVCTMASLQSLRFFFFNKSLEAYII